MAEAFTSVSDGTYGLYYNPAGMTSILSYEIQSSYSLWMQKINFGYIGGIFTESLFGKIKIGSSYSFFEINRDDELSFNVVDWSLYDGSVQKISNNKFTFAAAFHLFDIVAVGLS